MAIASERDRQNKKLGKQGEKAACSYLKKQGYKILGRNWKNPFGEVDIIACKGDITAFIEVKTRLSDKFGRPHEAVTPQRRQKYIDAANCYFKGGITCTVRFDIIEIFQGELNHIENAFY